MRSFFDTNVLAYLFDNDAPEKKVAAQALIEKEAAAGQLVISTQVLQELYVTITRKLSDPLPEKEAEEVIRHFSSFPVIGIDPGHILGAIARSRLHRFSFWDSLIIESALSSGAETLFTEDLQDGRTVDGLRIQNPFR
jgi:predicted nucleic acid-binding protein